MIEVEDNNPYAVWSSYEDIGDLNSQLIVPALVDFSYEVGFDPRNEVGLGLKSRNSKHKGPMALIFRTPIYQLSIQQVECLI